MPGAQPGGSCGAYGSLMYLHDAKLVIWETEISAFQLGVKSLLEIGMKGI